MTKAQNASMMVAPKRPVSPVSQGVLQRKCACGQHTVAGGECAECRKKRQALQRRPTHGTDATIVPPIVHDVLRSPGQPLDEGTRSFMESRFGHDFSGVRVHTGENAAESAQAVGALAYTVGRNVAFGRGQYAPGTPIGRRLLAHELAHVVQQRNATPSMQNKLTIGHQSHPLEREADQVTAAIVNEPARAASGSQMHTPSFLHTGGTMLLQRSVKGAFLGAGAGLLGGALIGAAIGGLPGALIGGLIGGLAGLGIGALASRGSRGKTITVDPSCKSFCPGTDIEEEAKKADAKTTDSCKDVTFTYQIRGESSTRTFSDKITFNPVIIKCDSSNTDCGGWSSRGEITLGKAACSAGSCGPLDSTILHEMVHDWAGFDPPYDKENVTVPGATHTNQEYLDEWVARYVEKSCFAYNPWGLP